jgi:uncharacterized protein YceH (UPF0502 family)
VTIHRLPPNELRVLGCLIEKQRTTPEQYPLTLNALRLACNQATNREPVVELDESEVRAAAQSLGTLGYARLATGPGSRTAKYRQLFGEALDLMPAEISILAVLMLRGPQTVPQLKTRTERLHAFASNDEIVEWLQRLDGKELVHLLGKQPGQREERWTHLLAEQPGAREPAPQEDAAPTEPSGVTQPSTLTEPSTLEARLAAIEARLDALEQHER